MDLHHIHTFARSEIQTFPVYLHSLIVYPCTCTSLVNCMSLPRQPCQVPCLGKVTHPIIRSRVQLSCPRPLVLPFFFSLHTRTYTQPGFIRSFQRGTSCQCYHGCIDKVLHVKSKPLWRIYDTSLLKCANNEDHINLSRSFHETAAHSAYANVSVMIFSGMTEQFWG